MKILAIDTSTKRLCLAVGDGDKLYGYELELATKMSAFLVPSIERVIAGLGWKIDQIDCFCCGIGPGSFTGVRVGMAAVKALSWSLDKPVVGVSSLDLLAENGLGQAENIIPVIDARRGMVYAAVYNDAGGRLKRASGYLLLTPEQLAKKIRVMIPRKRLSDTVVLGDGLNVFNAGHYSGFRGIKALDRDYWKFEPESMIGLAKEALRKNRATTAFRIEPLYLYPKECQIRTNSNRK